MTTSVSSRLLTFAQRLVPARLLARLVYRISRLEQPVWKNFLIRAFSRLYHVDTLEAARSVPDEYASFNEFFTRELKPDARSIDDSTGSVCCPADGTITQIDYAHNGTLIQAKGLDYRLQDLLADPDLATTLRNSAFTSIYLAPYNYHRVHMPIAGALEQITHVPGKLFSVNAATTSTLDQLYVRNERLVCQFINQHGKFVVVLVGAMNVGSFNTAWSGEISGAPNGEITRNCFAPDNKPPQLNKGDYLGHFNMGSTVIFIAPPEHLRWSQNLEPGMKVQMGNSLGTLGTS